MSNIMNIRYSVLMAVYIKDNPEWLGIALDSMYNQTIRPTEIVLVKDGNVTPEIESVIIQRMDSYGGLMKVYQLPENRGLGEALRQGILMCSCEWIVRMDSDDYAVPNRCEIQFRAQKEHQADMVGCDINEFTGTPENVVAKRVFPERHEDIVQFGKRRTPFSHPGIVMRRNDVLKAGNYRTAHLHEDYDLFVRMLMNGCKGYTVKEPLVYMRVSEDFYARRGGIKYLKELLHFNRHLYKIGWMAPKDFAVRSTANIISCLMPNSVRDLIYKKILRK